MGIKGLLQFLSSAQRDVNVSSFKGQTVAVDAYCWLHKGAYSCAMQLVMKTEKCENLPFVRYCMKRINLLRQYDITPIVVFDGANLPMKRNTETERRERRKSYLQKGKALLKDGRQSEAYECFQKCVDVSPEMALAFIKELRKDNIEVVVAPYEADAQLAYLVKENIAHFVITEDSDLLAFGCPKVLFKMNDNGDGKLIEYDNIGKSVKSLIGFTPDSFRHACILGGCDYLQSILGVGVATAVKLMRKHNKDPYNVIKGLKRQGKSKVPSNYEEDFHKADDNFLYQVVYDPRSQMQVRLTTPPIDSEISSVGIYNSPSKQVGLARGNINPLTLETMDTFSPAKHGSSNSNSNGRVCRKSLSWTATGGSSYPIKKQTSITVSVSAKRNYKNPLKKIQQGSIVDDDTSDNDLKAMYGIGAVANTSQTSSYISQTSSNTNQTSSNIICRSKYFQPNYANLQHGGIFSQSANNLTNSCNSSLVMIEEHNRLKHTNIISTSTNNIISTSTNNIISTSISEQLSATEPIEDSDMIVTDEDRTICDNDTPVVVSINDGGVTDNEDGVIDNEVEGNNEVEGIVQGSSNGPLIDETNIVLTKKRMRLELSENTGVDIKRFKLNNPTNNTNTLMKRPVSPPAKRKPSLRLGLSKRICNGNNKDNKIFSYFCYKGKDKLV